mgnify:CR=1 FL=1
MPNALCTCNKTEHPIRTGICSRSIFRKDETLMFTIFAVSFCDS